MKHPNDNIIHHVILIFLIISNIGASSSISKSRADIMSCLSLSCSGCNTISTNMRCFVYCQSLCWNKGSSELESSGFEPENDIKSSDKKNDVVKFNAPSKERNVENEQHSIAMYEENLIAGTMTTNELQRMALEQERVRKERMEQKRFRNKLTNNRKSQKVPTGSEPQREKTHMRLLKSLLRRNHTCGVNSSLTKNQITNFLKQQIYLGTPVVAEADLRPKPPRLILKNNYAGGNKEDVQNITAVHDMYPGGMRVNRSKGNREKDGDAQIDYTATEPKSNNIHNIDDIIGAADDVDDNNKASKEHNNENNNKPNNHSDDNKATVTVSSEMREIKLDKVDSFINRMSWFHPAVEQRAISLDGDLFGQNYIELNALPASQTSKTADSESLSLGTSIRIMPKPTSKETSMKTELYTNHIAKNKNKKSNNFLEKSMILKDQMKEKTVPLTPRKMYVPQKLEKSTASNSKLANSKVQSLPGINPTSEQAENQHPNSDPMMDVKLKPSSQMPKTSQLPTPTHTRSHEKSQNMLQFKSTEHLEKSIKKTSAKLKKLKKKIHYRPGKYYDKSWERRKQKRERIRQRKLRKSAEKLSRSGKKSPKKTTYRGRFTNDQANERFLECCLRTAPTCAAAGVCSYNTTLKTLYTQGTANQCQPSAYILHLSSCSGDGTDNRRCCSGLPRQCQTLCGGSAFLPTHLSPSQLICSEYVHTIFGCNRLGLGKVPLLGLTSKGGRPNFLPGVGSDFDIGNFWNFFVKESAGLFPSLQPGLEQVNRVKVLQKIRPALEEKRSRQRSKTAKPHSRKGFKGYERKNKYPDELTIGPPLQVHPQGARSQNRRLEQRLQRRLRIEEHRRKLDQTRRTSEGTVGTDRRYANNRRPQPIRTTDTRFPLRNSQSNLNRRRFSWIGSALPIEYPKSFKRHHISQPYRRKQVEINPRQTIRGYNSEVHKTVFRETPSHNEATNFARDREESLSNFWMFASPPPPQTPAPKEKPAGTSKRKVLKAGQIAPAVVTQLLNQLTPVIRRRQREKQLRKLREEQERNLLRRQTNEKNDEHYDQDKETHSLKQKEEKTLRVGKAIQEVASAALPGIASQHFAGLFPQTEDFGLNTLSRMLTNANSQPNPAGLNALNPYGQLLKNNLMSHLSEASGILLPELTKQQGLATLFGQKFQALGGQSQGISIQQGRLPALDVNQIWSQVAPALGGSNYPLFTSVGGQQLFSSSLNHSPSARSLSHASFEQSNDAETRSIQKQERLSGTLTEKNPAVNKLLLPIFSKIIG